MEGRVSRGSRGGGGGWKRGGRGGHDGDSGGGENRGRGRGGHHRGRGKRDHYRARGRGGLGRAADFRNRDHDDDEVEADDDDDNTRETFSRRKLESNWDRYEESERKNAEDEDTPTQRGTDFQVLLESAGDSFTQFRFSEEKDWAMESSASSLPSWLAVDLMALSEALQQIPLHQRLDLEEDLVQGSTPPDLPSISLAPKQETTTFPSFAPPASGALKVPPSKPKVPLSANPEEDGDEELDQLLSLQRPAQGAEPNREEEAGEFEEEKKEEETMKVKDENEEKKLEEEVKEPDVTPEQEEKKKKAELTEEDLEDWLDAMIS